MNSFKILYNNQIYYATFVETHVHENASHDYQIRLIRLKLDEPLLLFEDGAWFQSESFLFNYNGNSFLIDKNGFCSEDQNVKIDTRDLYRFQKLFIEICNCCGAHISQCSNIRCQND